MAQYSSSMAMLDHMLEGHSMSLLEAMALLGVCNPAAELTKFRKKGFVIKSRRVNMARIVRRMNECAIFKVPRQLPYKECQMMEYWIER